MYTQIADCFLVCLYVGNIFVTFHIWWTFLDFPCDLLLSRGPSIPCVHHWHQYRLCMQMLNFVQWSRPQYMWPLNQWRSYGGHGGTRPSIPRPDRFLRYVWFDEKRLHHPPPSPKPAYHDDGSATLLSPNYGNYSLFTSFDNNKYS